MSGPIVMFVCVAGVVAMLMHIIAGVSPGLALVIGSIVGIDAAIFARMSDIYGDAWWRSRMRAVCYLPLGGYIGLVLFIAGKERP